MDEKKKVLYKCIKLEELYHFGIRMKHIFNRSDLFEKPDILVCFSNGFTVGLKNQKRSVFGWLQALRSLNVSDFDRLRNVRMIGFRMVIR